MRLDRGPNHGDEIVSSEVVALGATLDRREVEDVVDQTRQPLRLSDDGAVVFDGVVAGIDQPEQERFTLEPNLSDGRPELVADVGGKVCLYTDVFDFVGDGPSG